MSWKIICVYVLSVFSAVSARAEDKEFNPFDPNAQKTLELFDKAYEKQTGQSAFPSGRVEEQDALAGCRREACPIFIDIDKSSQTLRLYLDGRLANQWNVSTGRSGFETPSLDRHPDGRMYERYSSSKYPGGDWNGLGNMPYAIFISGGVAVHGTPAGNWRHLGSPASHGCIRQHPNNAGYLFGLVRNAGARNTWVTVH